MVTLNDLPRRILPCSVNAGGGLPGALEWRLASLPAVLIACLVFFNIPTATIASEHPAELHKLHALLIVDTLSDLEESVMIDGARMEQILRGRIPNDRLHLTVLTGKDVTAATILRYYQKLQTGALDAILCYYAGHGGTDPEKGHFLALQKLKTPPLLRSVLREAMEKHHPGLAIIITDCCSDRFKLGKKRGIADKPGVAKQLDPVVRSLLFQHRGLVDITAATNNVACGDDHEGGLFTRSFANVLLRYEGDHGSRDRFVGWSEFFAHLQQETAGAFRSWSREQKARGDAVSQTTQTPYAYHLPIGPHAPILTIRNATHATVLYHYRWDGETTWNKAEIPSFGLRTHAAPASEREHPPTLQAKFEDGETSVLHVGKAYRYIMENSAETKKKRGVEMDEASDP